MGNESDINEWTNKFDNHMKKSFLPEELKKDLKFKQKGSFGTFF